jgi:hypothetical protein
MSKEGISKLVAGGRRALAALGLKRRPTPVPFVAALSGLALAVGAVFALPRAREAWARLWLRSQAPPNERSLGNGAGANGAAAAAEGARRATEGPEADELGRAENEGMHPGRW